MQRFRLLVARATAFDKLMFAALSVVFVLGISLWIRWRVMAGEAGNSIGLLASLIAGGGISIRAWQLRKEVGGSR